jgi:hypothetical protein
MIVVPTYRGYRIEVNAQAVDGRYNAEVRILRLFAREVPHVETVTCYGWRISRQTDNITGRVGRPRSGQTL